MSKFKEKIAHKKCCKIFAWENLGNFIKEGKERGGENILTSCWNKIFRVYERTYLKIEGKKNSEKYYFE